CWNSSAFRRSPCSIDRYVLAYIRPEDTAVEIGPGGGRWTRYLLDFKKLYVVDYHAELLAELKKNFCKPGMEFIKNNGTDFPVLRSAPSITFFPSALLCI